jgi:hypothetical protein
MEIRMQDQGGVEIFHGYVDGLDDGVVIAVFKDSEGDRHEAEFPLRILPEAERDRVRVGSYIDMLLSSTDVDIRLAKVVRPKKGRSDGEMLASYIRAMR